MLLRPISTSADDLVEHITPRRTYIGAFDLIQAAAFQQGFFRRGALGDCLMRTG